MIYFVSDLHFSHENILKFENEVRSNYGSNVEEMNENIIKEWNATISKNDTVYNLGDFFFNVKPEKMKEIISRLNFKEMIIIIGNHDHKPQLKVFKELNIKTLYADVIKYNGKKFYLSHYPTLINRKNFFNVHGHIHSKNMDTHYHINVGLDNLKKVAISIDDVYQLALNLENNHEYSKENLYNL